MPCSDLEQTWKENTSGFVCNITDNYRLVNMPKIYTLQMLSFSVGVDSILKLLGFCGNCCMQWNNVLIHYTKQCTFTLALLSMAWLCGLHNVSCLYSDSFI